MPNTSEKQKTDVISL